MALTYSGGCAEYRLFPLVVFEPFRLRNGVYVFRGLRGVPLTPGYYLSAFQAQEWRRMWFRGLRVVLLAPGDCL
jgi:hypothetical protein